MTTIRKTAAHRPHPMPTELFDRCKRGKGSGSSSVFVRAALLLGASIGLLCADESQPVFITLKFATSYTAKVESGVVVESFDAPPDTKLKVIGSAKGLIWLEYRGIQKAFSTDSIGLGSNPRMETYMTKEWLATHPVTGVPIPLPATRQEIINKWQLKTVGKYPELGVQGSAFNKAFLAECERRKQASPESFLQEDWPMRIADDIAALQPVQPTTPANARRVQGGNSEGADMVRENGVLKVPVQINGAISLKFIVDSGASDVQIPKDVFLTLIRAETIKQGDFLPGKTFILADGSKVKSDRFILRSIKLGGSTFLDVEASVGGFDSPLLLGQSFLSRFDGWTIDNKKSKLILKK